MTPPRVFISYSYDSPAHKQWVAGLAAFLRSNGIDPIFDQWDLRPGDDVTLFMERGLHEADRVLVICTDEYVRKANTRQGGVGYEHTVVTGDLVHDLGTDKFIPVVRNSTLPDRVPRFLRTRIYVDLSDGADEADEHRQDLLRELHRIPRSKPPLGPSPFAIQPTPPPASEVRMSDPLTMAGKQRIEDLLEEAGERLQKQYGSQPIPVRELKDALAECGVPRSSILPSDHCYNRVNAGVRAQTPMFVQEAKGRYRFVGRGHRYTGPIYWKPQGGPDRQVGEWKDGKKTLWKLSPP